jgi:hypothetical protein
LIAEKQAEMQALVQDDGTHHVARIAEVRTSQEQMERERRDLVYQMHNQGVHDGALANVDPRIHTRNAADFAKMLEGAEQEINAVKRGCAEEMQGLDGELQSAKSALKECVAMSGTKNIDEAAKLTAAVKLVEERKADLQRATSKRISKIQGDLDRKRRAHIEQVGGSADGAATGGRRASISNTLSGMFGIAKPDGSGVSTMKSTTKRRFSLSRARDDAEEEKRQAIVASQIGRRRSSVSASDLKSFATNAQQARVGAVGRRGSIDGQALEVVQEASSMEDPDAAAAAAAAAAEQLKLRIKEEVTQIYQKFEPEKLAEVDTLLEKYGELDLVKQVRRKFRSQLRASVTPSIEEFLTRCGYDVSADAVADAFEGAGYYSGVWIQELSDMEDKAELDDFVRAVQKSTASFEPDSTAVPLLEARASGESPDQHTSTASSVKIQHPPLRSVGKVSTEISRLQRMSGFWGDPQWYDVHLSSLVPLTTPMIEELIFALPPSSGARVADCMCSRHYGAGGQVAQALLDAYASAKVTLLGMGNHTGSEGRRLKITQEQLRAKGYDTSALVANEADAAGSFCPASLLPGAADQLYDVVIAVLALHDIVDLGDQNPTAPLNASVVERYRSWFSTVLSSLVAVRTCPYRS